MDKFKAWWPIIAFSMTFFIGYGILQADAKNLKEKIIKAEEKIEELTKEEKEARLKQIEIDVRQSVILDNLDKLIEKLENKIDDDKRSNIR